MPSLPSSVAGCQAIRAAAKTGSGRSGASWASFRNIAQALAGWSILPPLRHALGTTRVNTMAGCAIGAIVDDELRAVVRFELEPPRHFRRRADHLDRRHPASQVEELPPLGLGRFGQELEVDLPPGPSLDVAERERPEAKHHLLEQFVLVRRPGLAIHESGELAVVDAGLAQEVPGAHVRLGRPGSRGGVPRYRQKHRGDH